jgi:hypothetical protein
MLTPQFFLSIIDTGILCGTKLYEVLLLLGVAGFKPLGDANGVEPLEGQFDLAGRGVVLPSVAVVVTVDRVQLGQVLVGVRVVERL